MEYIKRFFSNRLVRFFLVAGVNVSFGTLVYSLFIFIGLGYVLASFLGIVVAIIFNFHTYGIFVFGNRRLRYIFRFAGVYVIMCIVNVSGIYIFKNFVFVSNTFFSNLICELHQMFHSCLDQNKIQEIIAGFLMILPVGLSGFILNKNFVFLNNESEKQKGKKNSA
jgi:putative flippase GtrA